MVLPFTHEDRMKDQHARSKTNLTAFGMTETGGERERARDQPQVLVNSMLATKVAKLPQRTWLKQVFAASSMASFEGHPRENRMRDRGFKCVCPAVSLVACWQLRHRQTTRQAAAAVIITVAVELRAARIN